MSALNEDSLVQQTTSDYLHDVLGWDSVYAFNEKTFGPGGTLGRSSDRDVVLIRYLRAALEKLNPGLPNAAYEDAVRQIANYGVTQSAQATNRDKDALLRDGVLVSYLDKPLKAHTLMQAIALANRVTEGKNNGLIVDYYCGIFKSPRKALATFVGHGDEGRAEAGDETDGANGRDPAKLDKKLLEDLGEAIGLAQSFLTERGASLDAVHVSKGFSRNAAVRQAKEAVNDNDESRRRFETMCREVFRRFKSCLNLTGINAHRHNYDALNLIYNSLQSDRNNTDITDIIQQLHAVVDDAIETGSEGSTETENTTYDISRIDFEKLRKEFVSSPARKTTVQNLRAAIEKKLQRLMRQNPFRTDFQRHYETIVADYNREKNRATLEQTFEALVKFVRALDEEESRAMREELDEESLAIFDLLRKPTLNARQLKRIKEVSVSLLATLKQEKLRIDRWPEKETTRDAVAIAIHNHLFSDETGLPLDSYSEEEVQSLKTDVFRHVLRVYPYLPSPVYGSAA